jgi:hypothetical protein
MPDAMFIETPRVDAVLSLDLATDEKNQEKYLLLTIHLESGKTVRLPCPLIFRCGYWFSSRSRSKTTDGRSPNNLSKPIKCSDRHVLCPFR